MSIISMDIVFFPSKDKIFKWKKMEESHLYV